MGLQDKYKQIIDTANSGGVIGLQVAEKEGVLYVTGTAPSADVKDKLWNMYEQIDPEMRAGDMVLNITLANGAGGAEQTYEVKSGDNLSKIAKNYPGISWQDIFEANKDQLKDPNMIHPGQKLKIPSH
ncbi:LysM domain-containing protein [Chitinophaga skermanii]|uniref:LysM domain-containing protein n=1 Tax=Chitinophaga skermanii TaxID=331697 RepID=A0A327QIR1_9BACT|nr:LysM peptidoglycan-binding domain-containing protein [Chitinophaga skermanii]RAJ03875.1 LysM domain-containing protein [Chitinophaga skermanii]